MSLTFVYFSNFIVTKTGVLSAKFIPVFTKKIGYKQTDRQAKFIYRFIFVDAAPLPGAQNGAESSIIRSQSPGANPGICLIIT